MAISHESDPGPRTGAHADSADPGPAPESYEQARTELAGIVRSLETGNQSLEESLALWERGESLAALCDTWLQAARERLDASTHPNGNRNGNGTPDDGDPRG